MGVVVVVVNQKGGVGKTSSLASLAQLLVEDGHHVLCCDMDPQRNLDMLAGRGMAVPLKDTETRTMLDVLNGECDIKDAIVRDTPIGDLIRASSRMSGWTGAPVISQEEFDALRGEPVQLRDFLLDRFESGAANPNNVLRRKLAPLIDEYDYVLIDTNPSLMVLTLNALFAADYVLVPVSTDDFSREAVAELWNTLQTVNYYDPTKDIKVAGLLVTQSNRNTKVAARYFDGFEAWAQKKGTILFDTKIRYSTKAKEATAARKTIIDYVQHRGGIAEDYINFKKEFVDRIETLEQGRA